MGCWGPGRWGGQRSGPRVWAWSLGPYDPVPASAQLQKNPLKPVFLTPPRLGTPPGGSSPGKRNRKPDPAQRQRPRVSGPLCGRPACASACSTPALPPEGRRQGLAWQEGRTLRVPAGPERTIKQLRAKSTETTTNPRPWPVIQKRLPPHTHTHACGVIPGASLEFPSLWKNSRPRHSQDSRRGARVPQRHP